MKILNQTNNNKCLNDSNPIIMVDDSKIDISIAQRVHKRSDLPNPFLSFSSGPDFLVYMKKVKTGEEPTPALVLLDINMPMLNGFDTIAELRKQEEFSDIPIIIMLTNSDDPNDVEKARELGANGFQTKMFEIEKYVAFFNSLKSSS